MPSLVTLSDAILLEIIRYVVDRKPEISITYFARTSFQAEDYRDFQALVLVNKKISVLATKELYSKPTFCLYRTDEYPGDLPVFLNGLRPSTFDLVNSVMVEFPPHEETDFDAFRVGLDLLWHQPLKRLTIGCSLSEGLPRLEDIQILFDFDKIEEFKYELPHQFYLEEEDGRRELVDQTSDTLTPAEKALWMAFEEIKEVLENRKPRTQAQQEALEARQTRPIGLAVQEASQWGIVLRNVSDDEDQESLWLEGSSGSADEFLLEDVEAEGITPSTTQHRMTARLGR